MERPRPCVPTAAAMATCTTRGSRPWPEPGADCHPATIRRVRRLWRRVNRLEPARAFAIVVAAPIVAALAAYVLAAATASPKVGALTAAAALVAVAGSGLLYAWRLGAGGLSD